MIKDIKNLLKDIAPTIAAGLGGPLAGAATDMLLKKLFPGEKNLDANKIKDAISNGGFEAIEKITEADMEFKLKTEELGVNVFEMETKDRQDARQMYKINMWPQIILSVVFILAYFILLGYIMTHVNQLKALTDDKLLFGLMGGFWGVLTSGVIQILGFWFGSSKGSQDKTNINKVS